MASLGHQSGESHEGISPCVWAEIWTHGIPGRPSCCVCVFIWPGLLLPQTGEFLFFPPFYFWFFSSYFCVKKQRENREEENWAWQEKLWASGCFIDAHREKKNKYLSILFFFFFLGRFLFCFSTKQSPGVFWIGAGHKNSKLCGAVSCASPSMFGFFSRTS